jgi:hypothetical protein
MSLRNYNWLGLRWFFLNCLRKPTPNQIIDGIMDELEVKKKVGNDTK